MGKYLTILFLFLCLTCMGQDMSKSKLIQKNDTLFLESNGEKYVVDKKHLVVKLKPSIKELDADIKQIDITKSGYRLIEVPNGIFVPMCPMADGQLWGRWSADAPAARL